jgi:hypothetical protein
LQAHAMASLLAARQSLDQAIESLTGERLFE